MCGAGGQADERLGGLWVASMCNICTGCRGWGRRVAGAVRNVGEGDLHVDASAVVGERGLRASLIRGANDQLGTGSAWVC